MRKDAYDLTGMIYGRWTVIDHAGKCQWNCVCKCGKQQKVRSQSLRRGHTTGCFDCWNKARTTHGHCKNHRTDEQTPTYRVWAQMLARCRNPKSTSFKHYGMRGISVCERWWSFTNFLADMGLRPLDLQLDRKNNNGNYEPGNCRWATRSQQRQNTRNTRWVMLGNEKLALTEVARRLDVWRATLDRKVRELGLSEGQMAEIVSVGESYKGKVITVKISDLCCA